MNGIRIIAFYLFVVIISCSKTDEKPRGLIYKAEAPLLEMSFNEEIWTDNRGFLDTYSLSTKEIGKATFEYQDGITTLTLSIDGLAKNTIRAVHIHEGTPEMPGRHWNAGSFVVACNERSLGEPWRKLFIGDVGNVVIGENGVGKLVIQTNLWTINTGGANDILKKTVVVHQNEMNFELECDPSHT